MKKNLSKITGAKLAKSDMLKIRGGYGSYSNCDNRCWICGCLDVEDNFYPGPCGGGYCLNNYGAEPWCIRRPGGC